MKQNKINILQKVQFLKDHTLFNIDLKNKYDELLTMGFLGRLTINYSYAIAKWNWRRIENI